MSRICQICHVVESGGRVFLLLTVLAEMLVSGWSGKASFGGRWGSEHVRWTDALRVVPQASANHMRWRGWGDSAELRDTMDWGVERTVRG